MTDSQNIEQKRRALEVLEERRQVWFDAERFLLEEAGRQYAAHRDDRASYIRELARKMVTADGLGVRSQRGLEEMCRSVHRDIERMTAKEGEGDDR